MNYSPTSLNAMKCLLIILKMCKKCQHTNSFRNCMQLEVRTKVKAHDMMIHEAEQIGKLKMS
jgi:hypothetical protein